MCRWFRTSTFGSYPPLTGSVIEQLLRIIVSGKMVCQLLVGHRIEGCALAGVEINSNGTGRGSESRMLTTQCRITSAGV
jgi:hypothetical protein